MSPPPSTVASMTAHDRRRATEVAAAYDNVVVAVVGATGAAAALAVSLVRFGVLDIARATLWVLFIGAGATAHTALRIAYRRSADAQRRWRFWGAAFTAVSLVEGLGWGWASVFLIGSGRLDLQLLVFVVCFGVAAGSVPAFGSFLPALGAFFIPATMPEFVWSVQNVTGAPTYLAFSMLTAVFISAMAGLGLRMNAGFRNIVELQIRAGDLADELREQKDIAEQANRAKSAFLAAASHDLRQPVHALSLFVGALRNVAMPEDGARLVDQIEASTLALDGLFGALLDISRLDAGIVDVQPRAFAIDELLERICSDHAAEAAAKALSLRRVACSRVVFTDPVLMERILRNLVVNAIRHTREGRILVGCRRRGGRLDVLVCDTGRGIPADQHERIFQEYIQLDNPARDRVNGLGLGLAIVRRLSTLLDCPVGLRSVPGRGSRFGVSLPTTDAAAISLVPDRQDVLGRERGLILVIDDEEAIREGMARLLGGWGYRAIVAAAGEEMLQRLSTCRDVPVLIVCDYRLREGERGSDVIERLQSEYNDTIPAILITGDTAPDRLVEAQASGFLLLHKPVPNGKLRAAISHLIAASQAGDAPADEPQVR